MIYAKSFYLKLCCLIFAFMLVGCESIFENIFGKDEKLTFIRRDYKGYELRTDGYYYFKNISADSIVKYHIHFFYRNGVVLECGNPTQEELKTREEEFKNGKFNKYVSRSASSWGIFKIDSSTIQIELLYYSPFRAYINYGEIINDTTFVLKKRKSSYSSEEIEILGTCHFKKFYPKPDSTNNFIK